MPPITITLDAKASGFTPKDRDEPLTNEDGKLKAFGKLTSILGKSRLRDVPSGKITPQQSIILNKTK